MPSTIPEFLTWLSQEIGDALGGDMLFPSRTVTDVSLLVKLPNNKIPVTGITLEHETLVAEKADPLRT